jgi:hypothetical protein
MRLINFIKEHNIKFNPRPFTNPAPVISSQILNLKKDSFVDLHLEIAEKVDALIAENEKDKIPEFKEVSLFEDYEQTVLNPLKQELMQRYSLWLE